MFRLLKDTDQVEHSIAKSFQITNREIWNSEVDTNLSGSTTVAVLLTKDKVKLKQKFKGYYCKCWRFKSHNVQI